ncbi:MAG: NADH-quinone oxidoreductase subunit [Symbiobacteriaceae bacterium]|jgi:NADH-quinone oxidoreductase subunit D|nr:NADH-quinone oxidoreductase subunit [Symbiobacteriaceae bacterium]
MAQTFDTHEKDTMTLSIGPHHPATHGVLRVILELNGETIVKAMPETGFLHTGIEKTAENLTWNQATTVVDRMDYLNSIGNNVGYCLAVEKLLGITDRIPERATVARVVLMELQRITSHLVYLGTGALDLGAMTPFFWTFDLREQILDIFEEVTGQRMNPSYMRAGGLAHDLPEHFGEMVRTFLKIAPGKMQDLRNLILGNPIFIDRTVGVAKISMEKALALGQTGHNLRITGCDYDVRKYYPYCGYENYDFKVPVRQNGDLNDRISIRFDEIDESLKIIQQGIDNLPDGRHIIEDRKLVLPPKEEVKESMEALIHHFKLVQRGFDVPAGEVYQAVESPRGELGFYLISDGGNKPMRMRVRGPAFYATYALEHLLPGHYVGDMAGIIAGQDPIFGEVDR